MRPSYSTTAMAMGLEGYVILRAIIDKEGQVKASQVAKGLGYGLDSTAKEALEKWRFKPGTLNGEPVDVLSTLTLEFSLENGMSSIPR
ncbi:energy transducer TonB [Acidobacteriota bacterium]